MQWHKKPKSEYKGLVLKYQMILVCVYERGKEREVYYLRPIAVWSAICLQKEKKLIPSENLKVNNDQNKMLTVQWMYSVHGET